MNDLSRRRMAVAIALAAFSASACSGSPATQAGNPTATAMTTTSQAGGPSGATQTSDGGQVTVVASWGGPSSGAVFDLKLDTHSVDLDALDLSDAQLRNDRGQTLSGASWAAPKGGHHREGALTFEGDAAGFLSGASWIELVIRGVGDVAERTLRWEVAA